MPKVSVILSSYNHAPYVAEAIESVLHQTFRDFELLIYDDGSTDGSADVIRSFEDPRIRTFLYEENRGPLEALQEAFHAAKGEYIAVHHSDDAWEPDKLEKQVRFLDEHSRYAACFTLVKFMDEEGADYVPPEGSFYSSVFQQPNRTQAEWLRHFFFSTNCLCHPSLLIRREKYEAYGMLDLAGLWQLPDFCMWVKLSLHEPFYIYQEPLTRFRLRRGKQTQQGGERADVSIRSQFELYRVLQLYREIQDRKLMLEVFPESGKYLDEQEGSIPFALAMVALGVKSPPYQMMAMNLLYDLVHDEASARELARRYHYTLKDFVLDTGREDVFRTASSLEFLHVTISEDSGECRVLGQASAYVTAGGAFRAEAPVDLAGTECGRLLIGFHGNRYQNISVAEVSMEGRPMEFSPQNAVGRNGEYDTFRSIAPRYTALCKERGSGSLAVSGRVDRQSLLDPEEFMREKDVECALSRKQRDEEHAAALAVGKALEEREAELAEKKAALAAKERELALAAERAADLEKRLSVRDEELEAIKATRGWQMLLRLRGIRDGAKHKTEHSLYNLLARPGTKRLAHGVGDFMQQWAPSLYERAYLPLLAKAKQQTLSYSVGAGAAREEEEGVPLWRFATEEAKWRPHLVSVIVPNYNHGAYLRERLESIYRQTYGSYEVILLDDCSTDDSREILREYKERYPDRTQLAFNESNSGNVFAQWKKGLSLAKGELVWIAESDDWCEDGFLERMVRGFADEAVMLAFCRSDFMQEGRRIFTTEEYLSDLPGMDWGKPFTMAAAQLVPAALSIKNIIPNVSSAVFRKPAAFSGELEKLWENMRLCGDWAFYLDLLKGGCLFYTPETTNFYRVHGTSTSLKIQKEPRYYEEHESIARFVARNYNVPRSSHERHLAQLKEHYLSYFGGKDSDDVEQWFRMEEVLAEKRRPNVLMCLFSMSIGGGETFPLVLANELKQKGVPVAVLDFQMSDDMPGIRDNLRPDVPYIRLKGTEGLASVAFQWKADIAHSHHGSVDEAVHYAIPHVPGMRQVITLHGMYESTEERYLKPLLDKVRETCSAFVYIADKNLVPFREHGGFDSARFTKIGNGLAFSTGTPIPREKLGLPEDAFVLCVVSRAIPEKGWQAAIDAVTLARKTAKRDIHLLLVGGGEMYDRLQGKVPKYIHLMGFRSNVRDYFATADMGLLPSEFKGESFPLMLIDCLFAGRPVIASDLGESRNQLKDEAGELAGIIFGLVDGKVPVEELARDIGRVADDPACYGILRQRVASAAEKFFMNRVAGAYIEVYEKVLHAPEYTRLR